MPSGIPVIYDIKQCFQLIVILLQLIDEEEMQMFEVECLNGHGVEIIIKVVLICHGYGSTAYAIESDKYITLIQLLQI